MYLPYSFILQCMQVLSQIALTQFKNYDFTSLSFTDRIVGICGANGKGKTNLLDAIYYLCFTKSYFTRNDQLNTHFEKDGFRLEGRIGEHRLVCIYRGAAKKEFLVDDVAYTKMSNHIGRFPAVMVAPDDVGLITGTSEERRRYIDTLLSQVDNLYLQQLIAYNKILQQRNSLLKRFADTGRTDWQLLETIDEQLLSPGTYIHEKRKAICEHLVPITNSFYLKIAGKDERVELEYESQLNSADFYAVLNGLRQKDFLLQRSNGGVHKDDLLIRLHGQPFKTTASQGQRKSLLFALKLAEYELIKAYKKEPPILLLDDVFEKLDDRRMGHLLQWVCNENDGQVFITDTHHDRLHRSFAATGASFQLINI